MTTRAIEAPSASRRLAVVGDYVRMTKPRVVSLLLLTTLCAMLAAERGWPPGWVVLWTMVGGYLSAGGAHAVNQFLDRDIDARMPRTTSRPVASGRVSPRDALAFGLVLAVVSTLVLGLLVNWAAAGLALAGFALYVGLYTLWLKRTTPHNIVIGGAAGAVPPLVGWAAATGHLALGAWLLFAIVFVWTPPHFWALSLVLRDDYATAGVPMLPVVSGARRDPAADPVVDAGHRRRQPAALRAGHGRHRPTWWPPWSWAPASWSSAPGWPGLAGDGPGDAGLLLLDALPRPALRGPGGGSRLRPGPPGAGAGPGSGSWRRRSASSSRRC